MKVEFNQPLKRGSKENPFVFNLKGKLSHIPYIFLPSFDNRELLFMVDTGADISIIKSDALGEKVDVLNEIIYISGIGGGGLCSKGKVSIDYKFGKIPMHVVGNDVTFLGDGILGSDFFDASGAQICYQEKAIRIENLYLPFLLGKDREIELENCSKK